MEYKAAGRRTIWNALRGALRINSGKNIYNFGAPERLRTLRCSIFTRRGYPLSHLATLDASSPKGTPWSYAGNFAATTKSRPLGEGGCDQREQAEGVSEQQRTPPLFFSSITCAYGVVKNFRLSVQTH